MQRIGIDAGGSLIKLAYQEKGKLHVKTYRYGEKDDLTSWLNMLARGANAYGTGGKWSELQEKLNHPCYTVDEFPAIIQGTNYLLTEAGHGLKEYLLVSVGTGTSIFHVNEASFQRVHGSGIGGGAWMGLGSLLTGKKSFRELVELSALGNREKVDLLVKDIYRDGDTPITSDLTAANFGKAHLSENVTEADQLRALTQMIAEVILSLAATALNSKGLKEIVFVGSTLHGNEPLKEALRDFEDKLSYRPIFIEKGAYAGAIGALLG